MRRLLFALALAATLLGALAAGCSSPAPARRPPCSENPAQCERIRRDAQDAYQRGDEASGEQRDRMGY